MFFQVYLQDEAATMAAHNSTAATSELEELSSNYVSDTSFMQHMSASYLIITIILSTIVVCTLVGNLFVIVAILVDKNLQTNANQLVLSLAVADLMVSCLVMPLGAYNDINQGWHLGKGICEFWTSADVLCCTASILNLLAIALDRYWAVTNVDYIYKRTRKRVCLMILCAWTVGAIVSLAPIFGWKDPDFAKRVLEEHKCLVSQDVAYQIFATISTFYAPLVLLLALYWRIFQVARKRIRCKPGCKSGERAAAAAAPCDDNLTRANNVAQLNNKKAPNKTIERYHQAAAKLSERSAENVKGEGRDATARRLLDVICGDACCLRATAKRRLVSDSGGCEQQWQQSREAATNAIQVIEQHVDNGGGGNVDKTIGQLADREVVCEQRASGGGGGGLKITHSKASSSVKIDDDEFASDKDKTAGSCKLTRLSGNNGGGGACEQPETVCRPLDFTRTTLHQPLVSKSASQQRRQRRHSGAQMCTQLNQQLQTVTDNDDDDDRHKVDQPQTTTTNNRIMLTNQMMCCRECRACCCCRRRRCRHHHHQHTSAHIGKLTLCSSDAKLRSSSNTKEESGTTTTRRNKRTNKSNQIQGQKLVFSISDRDLSEQILSARRELLAREVGSAQAKLLPPQPQPSNDALSSSCSASSRSRSLSASSSLSSATSSSSSSSSSSARSMLAAAAIAQIEEVPDLNARLQAQQQQQLCFATNCLVAEQTMIGVEQARAPPCQQQQQRHNQLLFRQQQQQQQYSSRSLNLKRRFRALGQLVSFVQTSRPVDCSSASSMASVEERSSLSLSQEELTKTSSTDDDDDDDKQRNVKRHKRRRQRQRQAVPTGSEQRTNKAAASSSCEAAAKLKLAIENRLSRTRDGGQVALAPVTTNGTTTTTSTRNYISTSSNQIIKFQSNGNEPIDKLQTNVSSKQQVRRQNIEIKREKKAAKTLAIITGVFVCCWLPFFVNAIVMPVCGPACTPTDLVLSILLWLGYLNSLLNPLIYTIFSPDFRRAFRRLLLWQASNNNNIVASKTTKAIIKH